jgi:ubiquinone/menaquinone biosynthesis C-methylase UbiE
MRLATAAVLSALVFTMHGCAACKRVAYEGWRRDRWQQPERVIAALELRTGERVADVGAGSGYFTFRLAEAVGPDGVVYAVDTDAAMVAYLRERARAAGARNVDVIQATPADPGIPPGGVGLLFTSNTYHHLDDPVAYFRDARRHLRPGGRVAILDLNDRSWLAWLLGHYTLPETMRADMAAAGFRVQAEHSFVPRQTFLVFVPDG